MPETRIERLDETLRTETGVKAAAPDSAIGRILPQRFFGRPTPVVAQELIGKVLLSRDRSGCIVSGRIVETEAYLAEDDPASHSHRGRTPRNSSMFGPPGIAYIYLIYGMHYCFNVVTAKEGIGEAVLIRAVEPLSGIELMRKRRGVEKITDLCRGPGRLAQAFGFDKRLDGTSLTGGPISIHQPAKKQREALAVSLSPRIGIRLAADLHLRYFLEGSAFVSR